MVRPTGKPARRRAHRSGTNLRRGIIALGLATGLVAQLLGCGSAPPAATRTARPPGGPDASDAAEASLRGPAALPARLIALLGSAEQPLLVARQPTGGLVLSPSDGRWWTGSFDARPDAPDATADSILRLDAEHRNLTAVGSAPAGEVLAALEPVGDGFVAVWVEPGAAQRELLGLSLDRSGQPRGEVTTVARSANPIRWVQVLPHEGGALVLWELDGAGGRTLAVAPWTAGRELTTSPTQLRGMLAWQAASTSAGAAVALVRGTGGGTGQGSGTGRVELVVLAPDGSAQTVVVSDQATAHPDVQLAPLGKAWILAWTDTRPLPNEAASDGPDAHVYVAAVQGGALSKPPEPALPPVGDQALVALAGAADGSHALLAWEPQLQRPAAERRIELTTVDAAGTPTGRRARLHFHAETDSPRFGAASDGFVALTLAAMDLAPSSSEEQPSAADGAVPTLVRFDRKLQVVASEPVRIAQLDEPGIPEFMRGLRCDGPRCTALAGGGGPPTRLALVELGARQSPWRSAATPLAAAQPPRATRLSVLASSDQPLSKVSAVQHADGSQLVAWLTHVARPSGKGRKDRKSTEATLAYRTIRADGTPSAIHTLSRRAISVGGIDLEPLAPAKGASKTKRGGSQTAAMLGWVAPNNGSPQVFVTSLGSDGGKITQRAITKVRRSNPAVGLANEVFDVDLAANGRGSMVVAWVDTRDGNPEIYAARIDGRLNKKGSDRRITTAPGPSSQVQLIADKRRLYLVWSDAREQPEAGIADIYLAQLDPQTLDKLGPDQRLGQSTTHSHSPAVTLGPDGPVVWWLEDPQALGGSTGSGLRVMTLDAQGHPAGRARWLPAPKGGRVTSAVLGCRDGGCRGLRSSVHGTTLQFEAFSLSQHQSAPKTLMSISLGALQDVALTASSPRLDSAFFVTGRVGGGGRVRRLHMGW